MRNEIDTTTKHVYSKPRYKTGIYYLLAYGTCIEGNSVSYSLDGMKVASLYVCTYNVCICMYLLVNPPPLN